ncbi:MAG: nucleotidyltransferase family protein [Thermoanaerobaculia bacterium]
MTVALVPAAGRSSRMGTPKLLLPFGETATVLTAYLDALHAGGVERAVVVVAPEHESVAALARSRGATVTVNPEPDRGMLSSLRAGLEALGRPDADDLVVGPADFPALRASTVRALLGALEPGAALAVPTVDGTRGHPLAVAARLAREIPRLDPSIGLRQLLDRHAEAVVEVAVDDPGALLDVDDDASYRRALDLIDRPR